MTVPTLALSTGSGSIEIPQLGFGSWQVPDEEAYAAVAEALRVGYRHVDTAQLYENEGGVGRAIAESGVPHTDLFVTTKVWPTDYTRAETLVAFDASLRRLGLETLDLYLLHWPAPRRNQFVEAWTTLLELRDSGRIRAVGVSNFTPELTRLHDATGEWPAINQVELHPYLQQRELRDFHAANGILTEAWSPLASGKRVLADPVIADIAAQHGVSSAQAIIAWHLAIGNVVIPKSVTPSRITENFDVLGVALDDDDLAAIEGLDQGFRTGPDPTQFNG
ncbi:MAG: aldo/keto reductase [Tetrasphaera sp.]